jgi:GH25 family lysozyme M1 (1,4-beta-N-acetylmuramidase)
MANVKGGDISHYQTVTDYGKVRAALGFVYIKLTEGADIVDSAWRQHYNGCRGIPRMAYHFMRGSSAAEVANFVAQWRSVAWECDVVLDAEYPGVTPQAIKAWIDEFRRQTGEYHLWVYASRSFLMNSNLSIFLDAGVTLIAARYYANSADFSTLGWDHSQLGMYQYWNLGSIPGISGAVDLDVARVSVLKGVPEMETTTVLTYPGPPNKTVNDTLVDVHIWVSQLLTQVAGLQAAVAALAADPGITPDQIEAAINAAVAEHLQVTVSVTPTPPPTAP